MGYDDDDDWYDNNSPDPARWTLRKSLCELEKWYQSATPEERALFDEAQERISAAIEKSLEGIVWQVPNRVTMDGPA